MYQQKSYHICWQELGVSIKIPSRINRDILRGGSISTLYDEQSLSTAMICLNETCSIFFWYFATCSSHPKFYFSVRTCQIGF